MNTADKDALEPDEIERLEQLRQRMKDESEAWQKLLENLGKMRTRHTENTDHTETKKPTE